MHRILVAQEDTNMRNLLVKSLQMAGFEVVGVQGGAALLLLHMADPADLLVLDLSLPLVGAIEVLRALRPGDRVPVLVLTAPGQEKKRIESFRLGANECVIKPFSMLDLIVSIRGMLRHKNGFNKKMPLRSGPFLIDRQSKTLSRDALPVEVSPREYHVLEVLLTHTDRFLTRMDLLNLAWPAGGRPTPHSIDVTIALLRLKITLEGDPEWIESADDYSFRWLLPVQEIEP